MKDIQSEHDSRRINIRKVGVKSITYPIILLDKASKTQNTLAQMNMYVNLPHRFKGTHMSRFVEILHGFHGQFNLKTCHLILEEMKRRLDAEAAHLEITFPYFLTNTSDTHGPGMDRYDCRLHGSLTDTFDLVVAVDVPVGIATSGDTGHTGHSGPADLWFLITVAVRMRRFLWLEDLIGLVKDSVLTTASQEANVETVCRWVSGVLDGNDSFSWYKVVVKKVVNGYSTNASSEWPEPSIKAARQVDMPWFSWDVPQDSPFFPPICTEHYPRADSNE